MNQPAEPEGIEHKHIHEAKGSIFRRWPFGLAALAVVLSPAFFGVYGSNATLAGTGTDLEFAVEGPRRIRNGEFFEITVNVDAREDLEDVVVLIGASLFRDMTINTLLPDPSEHGFRNGSFEFHFGPLVAGESLQVKVDGQVNPAHTPSANRGVIAVADGETVKAKVDYAVEVLP